MPDWRALARIGLGQIDLYCRSFKTPPRQIVLDIDDTDDPVHGQQELALFNAHYDCTCFQPIYIFDGLSGKPVLSLLRPGKRPSGKEVAKVLRHVIRRIRKHWPKVQILVRGDSHYCSEPALALLEAMRCDYILGFAINSKLLEIAAPWRDHCDMRRSKMKPTVRRFHQLPYRAHEWSRSRKLIARVEATPLGTDVRFIVTNLEGRSKALYEKVFCARGAAENLIKDMKRWTRRTAFRSGHAADAAGHAPGHHRARLSQHFQRLVERDDTFSGPCLASCALARLSRSTTRDDLLEGWRYGGSCSRPD